MPPDFTACTLPVHCVKQIGESCLETVQELLTKAESPAASVKKQPLPRAEKAPWYQLPSIRPWQEKKPSIMQIKWTENQVLQILDTVELAVEYKGRDGLLLRRRSGSYTDSSWAPSSAVQHCPCCLQQDGFAEVPWDKRRSTNHD